MARGYFLTALVPFLAVQLSAQITDLGITPSYTEIYTLRSAGVKMISQQSVADTVTIYNPDLSVYMTVPIPPPVPPYTWHAAFYFSEDLFDTDPSTVEFLAGYGYSDSLGTYYKTCVYRADGTLLFTADSVGITMVGFFGAMANYEPIFNTPMGTRLVMYDVHNRRHVYSLPGVLPCPSCDGSLDINAGVGQHMAGTTGRIDLFPNPARSSAMVNYELLPGANQGQLCFFDSQGQLVKRVRITEHSGQLTVDTSGLASGNYSCRIETNAGFMGGPNMMVVR